MKFVLEPHLAHKAPVTQAIVLQQGHAEETRKTRTTFKLSFTWFSQEIVCFDEICFNADSKKNCVGFVASEATFNSTPIQSFVI